MTKLRALAVAACSIALFAAGCGGDDDDNGGGGQTADAEQAPAVEPTGGSGTVNWCIGKDTSGAYGTAIKLFREQNSNVRVRLVELPESADEQRNQLVQRLRAESAECDVLGMDVIWTAEFAAQGWLMDVGQIIEDRRDAFIPSTLETAQYEDKYWAVPYHTNAGFLYWRTNVTEQAPDSWEQVYQLAQENDGLVYQGARYEGLTVNFLELLYSAGGEALSEDGQEVEVNSDVGREVLTFMADGLKDGAVPRAVTTYKEEEARRAFENGNASFMRNWPYAYTLGKESRIADSFDIGPFPRFGEGEPASVLGGINLAISSYSDNPEGASAFVNFATQEAVQKANFIQTPVATEAPYDDPALQRRVPFAEDLKNAVAQGRSRPASPVYPQLSQAIYTNVHDALQGKASPEEALQKMQEDMEAALETF